MFQYLGNFLFPLHLFLLKYTTNKWPKHMFQNIYGTFDPFATISYGLLKMTLLSNVYDFEIYQQYQKSIMLSRLQEIGFKTFVFEKKSNRPEFFYTKTCTFLASTPKRSNVLYTQLKISEFLKLVTIYGGFIQLLLCIALSKLKHIFI